MFISLLRDSWFSISPKLIIYLNHLKSFKYFLADPLAKDSYTLECDAIFFIIVVIICFLFGLIMVAIIIFIFLLIISFILILIMFIVYIKPTISNFLSFQAPIKSSVIFFILIFINLLINAIIIFFFFLIKVLLILVWFILLPQNLCIVYMFFLHLTLMTLFLLTPWAILSIYFKPICVFQLREIFFLFLLLTQLLN